MAEIRVIGTGSPYGDDDIGWEIASAVAAQGVRKGGWQELVQVTCCDRPGVLLLDALRDAAGAVVIDACAGPVLGGELQWLDACDLQAGWSPHSSHGFGVAQTLALGDALHVLPPRVHILGVGIDPQRRMPEAARTHAVQDAVSQVMALIDRLVNEEIQQVRPHEQACRLRTTRRTHS